MSVRSETGEIVRDGAEGFCRCGASATTEIQVGWFSDLNEGAGGGQYDEICEECLEADFPK